MRFEIVSSSICNKECLYYDYYDTENSACKLKIENRFINSSNGYCYLIFGRFKPINFRNFKIKDVLSFKELKSIEEVFP